MKTPLATSLLFAVSLLAASQPALAATKKADARTAELVAALQAVSPDPLGGRLGLAAATAQAEALPAAKADRNLVSRARAGSSDQRAYSVWKGGGRF
jgi:hypothetical protein